MKEKRNGFFVAKPKGRVVKYGIITAGRNRHVFRINVIFSRRRENFHAFPTRRNLFTMFPREDVNNSNNNSC